MKAEARKSEDELLVQAIHKTMGQMEQLKQACLRLSVNADDELALFMRETERLLERAQSRGQETERQEPEYREQASTVIKQTIRPADAYVSGGKYLYNTGKSVRFIQRRSAQATRKRTSHKKRGQTVGVRAASERKRQQRQQLKPAIQPQQPKKAVERQQPKKAVEWQQPKKAVEWKPPKKAAERQQPKKAVERQQPRSTQTTSTQQSVDYGGIRTSSNLQRSL
ncbi:hypothetical protein [Paenibacillus silagei]|uniref:Uncharacterized protein n=1 Tax=Paenibacillus silagei TaxID=1670801 RepID=A0ABS4P245_9BACL|nr:hypothetical protein [Paenibacillus silagei]MBP2116354.1 hypothetical protein [Paenibacillus silagei]